MEITGKIVIDGRESQFVIHPSGYPGKYSQSGADTPVLGERVELLAAMADAAIKWASEYLCSQCEDHLLDDGEGYDGKCGNCADRDVCGSCDEVLHDADREVGLCPGCQEDEEEPSDESETRAISYADDGTQSHADWLRTSRLNQRIVEPDEDLVRQADVMENPAKYFL